jgi:hypothetical protein
MTSLRPCPGVLEIFLARVIILRSHSAPDSLWAHDRNLTVQRRGHCGGHYAVIVSECPDSLRSKTIKSRLRAVPQRDLS